MATDRPDDLTQADPEAERRAYEEGLAAARRGEEAAPGCTVTAEGRAWLRGYVAGAAQRNTSG